MVTRNFCAFVLIAVLSPVACVFAEPVYFVVSEIPGQEFHNDSYVLPLTDPNHIAHARDLIARGTEAGETIVVAKIAAGADGINRNVVAPGEPLWAWHVTEFESFADVTAEVLDGWPGDVEKDVPAWIANANGRVGFWSYTITQELSGTTIPLPAPLLGGAILMAGAAVARLRSR